MTPAGEYRTTALTQLGRSELTVVFAHSVPVPDLDQAVVRFFESAAAAGAKLEPGQSVQYGWATWRLMRRPDGTVGVLEPDLRQALRWTESVDQSAYETWRQHQVLARFGFEGLGDFPRQAQLAVTCTRALEAEPVALGRTEAMSPSDSGWFIGCTDDGHDHQAAEALVVKPLVEIAAARPALTQLFALPAGVDVLMVDGAIRSLFLDGERREPMG